MGHSTPSLQDYGFLANQFPTLKRGANDHCAYGAELTSWPLVDE